MVENKPSLIIYPPIRPLRYPLSASQVVNIFGLSKSTLFKWEETGLIPIPPRGYLTKGDRQFGENEIRAIAILRQRKLQTNLRKILTSGDLSNDKEIKAKVAQSSQGWLELARANLESTEDVVVNLPTGYTLHFGPLSKK